MTTTIFRTEQILYLNNKTLFPNKMPNKTLRTKVLVTKFKMLSRVMPIKTKAREVTYS